MSDPAEETSAPSDTQSIGTPAAKRKWMIVALVLALLGIFYYQYQDRLTLEELVHHEEKLLTLKEAQPALIYGGAFLLYVVVGGLLPSGATLLTLVYGKFFGFVQAMVLVSFASTTAATMAFLISRYLLHDFIQAKFGNRLARVNQALEREGAFYLFTLRLIPAVPFFVINIVMGLTPMRTATYWWVSQVGMLAGTAVYVYAGTTLPGPQEIVQRGASGILTPQLLAAFVILGLFPIVVKKILGLLRKPVAGAGD